jgi:protein-S-isoprenylcysteine O-methyltransferase Ste14
MSRSPSLLVRTPPPLLFAAALAVGFVLERKAPLALPGVAFAPIAAWFAATLIVAGVVLAASAVAFFRMRRTTLIPTGEPASLIVDGPYRWTRNPIYVAFTLIAIGATVWGNTWWPLLLLPAPLLVLHFAIIPYEERTLAARFGDEYRAYCARVRRWA